MTIINKQTEIINRVQIEHISLRTKLAISFNQGKINAIVPDEKVLFLPYLSFETKKVMGRVYSVRT